jgi:hypothetical protein
MLHAKTDFVQKRTGLPCLRLISTPENKQRIGPGRRSIQQAISTKKASGMIGSERGKMELVQVSHPPFCKFYTGIYSF